MSEELNPVQMSPGQMYFSYEYDPFAVHKQLKGNPSFNRLTKLEFRWVQLVADRFGGYWHMAEHGRREAACRHLKMVTKTKDIINKEGRNLCSGDHKVVERALKAYRQLQGEDPAEALKRAKQAYLAIISKIPSSETNQLKFLGLMQGMSSNKTLSNLEREIMTLEVLGGLTAEERLQLVTNAIAPPQPEPVVEEIEEAIVVEEEEPEPEPEVEEQPIIEEYKIPNVDDD